MRKRQTRMNGRLLCMNVPCNFCGSFPSWSLPFPFIISSGYLLNLFLRSSRNFWFPAVRQPGKSARRDSNPQTFVSKTKCCASSRTCRFGTSKGGLDASYPVSACREDTGTGYRVAAAGFEPAFSWLWAIAGSSPVTLRYGIRNR